MVLLAVRGSITPVPMSEAMFWQIHKADGPWFVGDMQFTADADTVAYVRSRGDYEGPYRNSEELRDKLHKDGAFYKLIELEDMPKQIYKKRPIEMSDELRKVYKHMRDEYIAEYGNVTCTASSKMVAMIRLQQISSGFVSEIKQIGSDYVDDDPEGLLDVDILPEKVTEWITPNLKYKMLLEDIESHSERFIILTHFTAEAAMLYELLQDKWKVMLFTGWKKTANIEDFQEGRYHGIIANTRCISRGYNLQKDCHHMHFYSNTFSLEDRVQVEGRIFRIGQQQPCVYYDYVYEKTVDEQVVEALQQRRSLLDFIMTKETSMKTLLEEVWN
jgi:SNF2 family DNA or RNA helicase